MQKKAAGHRSAKRSFLLCISLPCGNEGIAGFLGIGKSWNSANRGVRNNHTKPTIKPVCRLGKLAEFLDKSRQNDRKSNEMRWAKSTTRVLLSDRPWVRIPPGSPFCLPDSTVSPKKDDCESGRFFFQDTVEHKKTANRRWPLLAVF